MSIRAHTRTCLCCIAVSKVHCNAWTHVATARESAQCLTNAVAALTAFLSLSVTSRITQRGQDIHTWITLDIVFSCSLQFGPKSSKARKEFYGTFHANVSAASLCNRHTIFRVVYFWFWLLLNILAVFIVQLSYCIIA